MIVALYILIALVIVGLTLKLTDGLESKKRLSKDSEAQLPPQEAVQECCGLHITCERDSLMTSLSTEIEYFEDEELDAFAGRKPDEYSIEETEMFREVLLTLRPEEIAAWGRSIGLRGIELPADVRDELLLIVSEARSARLSE